MIVVVHEHPATSKSFNNDARFLDPLHLNVNVNLLCFHLVNFEPVIPHCPLRAWYPQIFRSNADQSRRLDFIDVHDGRAFPHFHNHIDVFGPRAGNDVAKNTCLRNAPAMKN